MPQTSDDSLLAWWTARLFNGQIYLMAQQGRGIVELVAYNESNKWAKQMNNKLKWSDKFLNQ